MPGLTDQAGGNNKPKKAANEQDRRTWEESMIRTLDRLRGELRQRDPRIIASHCDATYKEDRLSLTYWEENLSIHWPDLEIYHAQSDPVSTFDTAMIIYYLYSADGTPMADRWIGFRELPSGSFYNQAFQGYSGNRLAKVYGAFPEKLHEAALALSGWKLPALADYAYAFQPLPRIRLAATLWPGDDEFPAKASILFDAAASHYMVTDGLALLGSGLTGRLIKQLK